MNELGRNEVELEGLVAEAPRFSHENHGIRFFRFLLEVPRLSGQTDLLPILLAQPPLCAFSPGDRLHLRGQLRSFNNRSGSGSRLVLAVLAQVWEPGGGEAVNRAVLSGALCRPPIFRRTPLGRSICDLMLAVSRRCGRADYLPVIAWGQVAAALSARAVGDRVALEGRFQSRRYLKRIGGETEERTAYEVSVMHLLEPEETPVQPRT